MNIIPAIDILNGKCVRLLKGNYSDVTVYNENPIEQVKIFKNAGFKNIHIVDLNAAKTGGDENLEIIQNISCIEIQAGIPSSQLEDFLNDLSYMDYTGGR